MQAPRLDWPPSDYCMHAGALNMMVCMNEAPCRAFTQTLLQPWMTRVCLARQPLCACHYGLSKQQTICWKPAVVMAWPHVHPLKSSTSHSVAVVNEGHFAQFHRAPSSKQAHSLMHSGLLAQIAQLCDASSPSLHCRSIDHTMADSRVLELPDNALELIFITYSSSTCKSQLRKCCKFLRHFLDRNLVQAVVRRAVNSSSEAGHLTRVCTSVQALLVLHCSQGLLHSLPRAITTLSLQLSARESSLPAPDLHALAGLPALQTLEIGGAHGAPLVGVSSLTGLTKLVSYRKLGNLAPLANSLQVLHVTDVWPGMGLESLGRLTSLEVRCGDLSTSAEHLQALHQLPLKHLGWAPYWDAGSIIHVPPTVTSMTMYNSAERHTMVGTCNVTHLRLFRMSASEIMYAVSRLPSITHLDVLVFKNVFEDVKLSGLTQLANLRSLRLGVASDDLKPWTEEQVKQQCDLGGLSEKQVRIDVSSAQAADDFYARPAVQEVCTWSTTFSSAPASASAPAATAALPVARSF